MRLLIYEINRQTDLIIISGATPLGSIKGVWNGRKSPTINTVYHAELIIDHLTELSSEQSAPLAPGVSTEGDIVTFQGICEAMDEDVYFVRFDIDWLEMIDISELAFPKREGDFMSFAANCSDIRIYPYTL